jgi:hypothetical protein
MNHSAISSKKITVRPIGGLGNQLFIYFAGLYISKKLNNKLICDLSFLDTDRTKHGVSITSFILEGSFVRKARLRTEVRKKWDQISSLLSHKSDLFKRTHKKISNLHVSTGIGYDRGVESIWGNATLKGYFQTWKYVRSLEQKSDLRLEIRNPSIWFTRLVAIAEESSPIMIHVRQGDYRDDVNSFIGVLGPNYYKNAISEVRATGINSSIWVFSDEIESAKKLLRLDDDGNVFWIVAPAGTDPAEELAIMQFGGAHIIANSTFSWWGAYLSRSTKIVIAPGSWFKDQEEPLDLIPPEWKRIKNDWL